MNSEIQKNSKYKQFWQDGTANRYRMKCVFFIHFSLDIAAPPGYCKHNQFIRKRLSGTKPNRNIAECRVKIDLK